MCTRHETENYQESRVCDWCGIPATIFEPLGAYTMSSCESCFHSLECQAFLKEQEGQGAVHA